MKDATMISDDDISMTFASKNNAPISALRPNVAGSIITENDGKDTIIDFKLPGKLQSVQLMSNAGKIRIHCMSAECLWLRLTFDCHSWQ